MYANISDQVAFEGGELLALINEPVENEPEVEEDGDDEGNIPESIDDDGSIAVYEPFELDPQDYYDDDDDDDDDALMYDDGDVYNDFNDGEFYY